MTSRATALALLVLALPACRSVYHAGLPRVPGRDRLSTTSIEHCLGSLGLQERPGADPEMASGPEDAELVAVWTSRHYRSRLGLGATASLRRGPDRWRITFVPGPPGSSDDVVLFARGFARCMAIHDPDTAVELEGGHRLDLW